MKLTLCTRNLRRYLVEEVSIGESLLLAALNCKALIDSSEYGINVSSETTESCAQSALSGETEILKSSQQSVLGVTWCRASDELFN